MAGSQSIFDVAMVTAVLILSLATLSFVVGTGESYTFMMGHFPAPWGNEIRIGELEALMAVFFSLIMMLSVFGGMAHIDREVQDSKKEPFLHSFGSFDGFTSCVDLY